MNRDERIGRAMASLTRHGNGKSGKIKSEDGWFHISEINVRFKIRLRPFNHFCSS